LMASPITSRLTCRQMGMLASRWLRVMPPIKRFAKEEKKRKRGDQKKRNDSDPTPSMFRPVISS
jgi:hypothetical protein